MAKVTGTKQAARRLGVSPGWLRGQIAAGSVTPKRSGGKSKGRFVFSASDLDRLAMLAAGDPPSSEGATVEPALQPSGLARVAELEAERTSLLAQVGWARALAEERSATIQLERERQRRLEEELETQRSRVEALKALTVVDRLFGRHKAI